MTSNQDWQKLQDDIHEFTSKTFGSSTISSKMHHLKEEIEEVISDPQDRLEWADCLILLLDAARIAGFNTQNLLDAANDKMAINKKRKWGKADKNGVVKHVDA